MSSDTEKAKPRREDYQRALEHEHLYGHRGERPDDARRTSTAVRCPARDRVNRVTQIMSKPVTAVSPQTTMSAARTHFGRTTHQRLTRR